MRYAQVLGAILAIGLAYPAAAGADADCQWLPPTKMAPQTVVEIDRVWAGARVDFAGSADQREYFVGYYDQDRWLTVARIDRNSHRVHRQRLESRFAGWDNHNSVVLALDRQGSLHVAGNMHADKLSYFRASATNRPLIKSAMTGRDDHQVTYPKFVKSENGDLLFFYRSGKSGDGAWMINQWNGRTWTKLNDTPFLSEFGYGGHVSAYPSRFAIATDGYFHLAIVWRLTPDAATNVEISYAKTRDFVSWFDSRNRPLVAPLRPETAETVLHTGPGVGLLNNAKVSVDSQGRPVIVFTRQDKVGHNTVELLIADGGKWRNVLIAASDRGFPVMGTGSLPDSVALSEVDFSHPDQPNLYFRFPDTPGVYQALDPLTLKPTCRERRNTAELGKLADRPIPTMRAQIQAIDAQATLVWSAQPANNDRPPPCTPTAPLACRPPPSMLKLLISGNTGAALP